jgi:glutathione S-transferase
MGTIPALDDAGFVLAESETILEYLEERISERPLLPHDLRQRAQVRLLARLHDLHVEPKVRAMFALVRHPENRTELPELKAALEDKLTRLAEVAQPAPYMAGPTPTLADCGFAVTLPLAMRLLQAMQSPLHLPESLLPWQEALAADTVAQRALTPWRDATETWLRAAGLDA